MDSDEELLHKTVYTFKKINKPTNHTTNEETHKLQHSFAQLVADSTGPQSLLADESFWSSVKGDFNIDENNLNEFNCDNDSVTLETISVFDYCLDESVSFFTSPHTEKDSTKQEEEALNVIYKILFPNEYTSHSADSVQVLESLQNGIISNLLLLWGDNKYLQYDLLTNCIFQLMNSLDPRCLEDCLKVLSKSISISELWRLFAFTDRLKLLNNYNELGSLLQCCLILQSISGPLMELEHVKCILVNVWQISLDHHLYNLHFPTLQQVCILVVEWMGVDRLDLLIEWMDETGMAQQYGKHPDRLGRLMQLMNTEGDLMGQLGVKVIFDNFIATNAAITDFEYHYYSSLYKSDQEYIKDLIIMFKEINQKLPSTNLQSLSILLTICNNRLLLTFLEKAFINDCVELFEILTNFRSILPSNLYPIYIQIRNTLSTMIMYLRAFILSHKSHRHAIKT